MLCKHLHIFVDLADPRCAIYKCGTGLLCIFLIHNNGCAIRRHGTGLLCTLLIHIYILYKHEYICRLGRPCIGDMHIWYQPIIFFQSLILYIISYLCVKSVDGFVICMWYQPCSKKCTKCQWKVYQKVYQKLYQCSKSVGQSVPKVYQKVY